METLIKICSLIHEIPAYCVLIVIPFLMYGVFKKEYQHVVLNITLALFAFIAFWVADYQYNLWYLSTPAYNALAYNVSLVAYPILFIATYTHAFKIFLISINKISKPKKKYANNPSSSSTRMEAVG